MRKALLWAGERQSPPSTWPQGLGANLTLEEMQPLFDEVAETLDFLELMSGKLKENYVLSAMANTCEVRRKRLQLASQLVLDAFK
jgi:hypothetical protein